MPAALLYVLIAGIALGAVLTALVGAYLQHRAKRRQVLSRIPPYDPRPTWERS